MPKPASATSGNAVESASIVSRAAMLRVWRRKTIVMRRLPQPWRAPLLPHVVRQRGLLSCDENNFSSADRRKAALRVRDRQKSVLQQQWTGRRTLGDLRLQERHHPLSGLVGTGDVICGIAFVCEGMRHLSSPGAPRWQRSCDRTTDFVFIGTESLLTHRWREPDSNHRSRSCERLFRACQSETAL